MSQTTLRPVVTPSSASISQPVFPVVSTATVSSIPSSPTEKSVSTFVIGI